MPAFHSQWANSQNYSEYPQIMINSQVLPNTISFQEIVYHFLLQKRRKLPCDRAKGITTLLSMISEE